VFPSLRDRIKPGVRVLFVGINPGIRSSLTGHHFAGFSNRFWTLLFESRLVPRRPY
jgi:TDG/mug DNA glycosylase family protein